MKEESKETDINDTSKKQMEKLLENNTDKSLEIKTELDVTKDNLRLFVERWREHPNSPYMLEDSSVSLEAIRNVESMSLRGQSPSTPLSICSTSSDLSESSRTNFQLTIPAFGLERRASEGNSKNSSTRDPASQIVLAEEIIKLSEHLRSIAASSSGKDEEIEAMKIKEKLLTTEASIIPDKSVEGKTSSSMSEKKTREKSVDALKSRLLDRDRDSEVNEISEKLSTITRQRKLNGSTFNGSKNYDRQECKFSTFTLKRSSSRLNEALLNENIKNEEESRSSLSKTWRSEMRNDLVHGDTKMIERDNNEEMDLTPPWRKPRMKHRFGETCRDVPRISNLRDLHKSIDLDEPTSAKNLLLELLGEWEEQRPGGVLGRKSISVDWGESSVARKSMNSLAEYFQSKQKKSTKTAVSNSSTVYR